MTMHPHFYHWHNRAELKPETGPLLQARWEAAAKFAEGLTADDACSLLRLALFGTGTTNFLKRFGEEIVVQEPTFPPEGNAELLRVMAAAALYSQMETESNEGDAVALGLLAAAFQPDHIKPVCSELGIRAGEYLASEAERVRPTPKISGGYDALKKATGADDWASEPGAPQLIGEAVLELGDAMGRIAEENQFLWWLLSRRSSLLNKRREKITAKEYALVAGAEAAERVKVLPPPASVESLIAEVLSHCSKASNTAISLSELIDAAKTDNLRTAVAEPDALELCPLTGLLGVRHAGGAIDGATLGKFGLDPTLKVSPSHAATQYFRELMFLSSLAELG
jgi:hypothetical protein